MFLAGVFMCLVAAYLLFAGYVKYTYQFWAYQPVFHYHDVYSWIANDRVIAPELPEKNKFCDFTRINTDVIGGAGRTNAADDADDTNHGIAPIIPFLRNHYIRDKDSNYDATYHIVNSGFIGHPHPSFVSRKTIDGAVVGTMTSRPLFAKIKSKRVMVHYVEHLCVHSEHRRGDTATSMIQTHLYNQRHTTPEISVTLFKREGTLLGIVPVVSYIVRTFHLDSGTSGSHRDHRVRRIEPDAKGADFERPFIDLMRLIESADFDVRVIPAAEAIRAQILARAIEVFVLYDESHTVGTAVPPKPIAIYIYRDCETRHFIQTKPIKCAELAASFQGPDTSSTAFLDGFTESRHMIGERFDGIAIEPLSHNGPLMDLARRTMREYSTHPTAYFMYNYTTKPVSPDRAFILT
jgi:hypothetical protein